MSVLSARPQEYAATKVAAGSPALIAVDPTHAGLATAVNTAASDVAAASMLDSQTDTGGEIIAPKWESPLSAQEPTCEQLRAMWIFSKRQSRAAEVTNEIPTYRDPFVYNVWDPFYSSTRSFGGSVPMLAGYADRSRPPVFGRVVSLEPILSQRVSIGHRQRLYGIDGSNYGGMPPRIYGSEAKTTSSYTGGGGGTSSRRLSKYRHVGSNGSVGAGVTGGNQNSVNVQGSFQRLKELIWTERAKELTQQRKAEELAARAAVLKEIAKGQNIHSSYKPSKSESPLMDENRSPDQNVYQHLVDGRISIATGQSHYTENNYNNKKNSKLYLNNATSSNRRKNGRNGKPGNSITEGKNLGLSSSLRSYFTNTNNVDKLRSLPRLTKEGTGPAATVPRRTYSMDEEHSMGISRVYALRPSHFRERNRVLLREDTPLEKSSNTAPFSRKIRAQLKSDIHNGEAMLLQSFVESLNRFTLTPANKKKYDMKIGKDAFLYKFHPNEPDFRSLPSIGKAVNKSYIDKITDKYDIYEPPVTRKKDCDEVNTGPQVFLTYFHPQTDYPGTAKIDAVEFYDYDNY
ncbi:uncharacterized protein LOC101454621 [Ceratitis capitata]|nr:uncharacterized protein LOC101454621 [Ceratitis capitata]